MSFDEALLPQGWARDRRAQRPLLRPLDGRLVACRYAERLMEIPAV